MKYSYFLLLLLLIPFSNAEQVFYDTFNRADSNVLGNNWTQSLTGVNIFNNELYFNSTSGSVFASHTFTNTSNLIYWEFTTNTTTDVGVQQDIELMDGTKRCIDIRVSDQFKYVDAAMEINVQAFTVNQEYKHEIIANFSNQTFDWYINDILALDNGGFRDVTCTKTDKTRFFSTVNGLYFSDYVYVGTTELGLNSGIYPNAVNSLTSASVFPVTFALYNGTTTSQLLEIITNSTGSTAYFNYSQGNYTLVTNASGYIEDTTIIDHNSNITTIDIDLDIDNRIELNFFDEETSQKIDNVTFLMFSDSYSIDANTTTGNYTVNSLPQGLYNIRYESPGYRIRSYYVNVPLLAPNLINTTLYLLNESTGDSYLPQVLDSEDNPYNGYFQALRWYYDGGNTGEYRVVETSEVNAQGQAAMFLEFNTAQYIFRAIDIENNVVDAQFNTPTSLFNQVEIYRITEQTDFITTYNELGDLRATEIQYFNTTTQFYQFSFSNVPTEVNQICLEVTIIYGSTTNVSETCSAIGAGSLIYIFNSTDNPGLYKAVAYANLSSNRFLLDQRSDNFLNRGAFPQEYSDVAALLGFFVTLTGIFVSLSNPLIGILLASVGAFALGTIMLNILPIGGFFLMLMGVVGFILAFVFKK